MPASIPRFAASAMRVGMLLGDTLFLFLLLSLVGFAAWHISDNAEWAGLLVIGGAVAGTVALFSFAIFGLIGFVWNVQDFWRSPHPVNVVLLSLGAAGYAVIVLEQIILVCFSALVGMLVFAACHKWLPKNPKWWLAICAVILGMRYSVPWHHASILAAGVAIFTAGATFDMRQLSTKDIAVD